MRARLESQVLHWLLSSWVPLMLLTGICWVLAYSLDKAGWVPDDSAAVTSIFLGLAAGWALARSHLRGWVVILYCLFLSVLVIFLIMGNLIEVLPTVFFQPFIDFLNQLYPRAGTMVFRVSAWYQAIISGGRVSDTGFFLFLVSFLGWNSAAWLAWAALHNRRAFDGLLPVGFLLAVNVYLSAQPVANFWMFTVLGLFLMVRTNYIGKHFDWDQRGVDYPESVELEWSGAALALTLIITTAALATTVIATPEGWQALSKIVHSTKEQTDQTAERLFTGVTPPRTSKPVVRAQTPDMSSFGFPLPQGNDVIFWVKTSDAPPPPPEARPAAASIPRHYWRSSIYTTYTPEGWRSEDQFNGSVPQVDARNAPPRRYPLTQEFDIQAEHGSDLYAANQPVQASGGAVLRYSAVDDTSLISGDTSTYKVISWVNSASSDELNAASTQYPSEITRLYLQLPASLPARVRQLADQIVAGQNTPFQKAIRIQDYLRQTYKYDLSARPPGGGKDYVDYFLFESQAGYCSQFSTAMTVLLRAEGVPARVATGYSNGEYDRKRAAYKIITSNAHAWVEAYFPGYGWVEFEPTPALSPFQFGKLSQPAAHTFQPITGSEQTSTPASTRLRWVFAGLGTLLLIGAAFLTWRLLRADRQVEGGQVGRLYWRIRHSLRWAGLRSNASETPSEFIQRYHPILAGKERLWNVIEEVTSIYQQAAFSAHLPPALIVNQTGKAWQQAWLEWLHLWFNNITRRK